MSLPLSLPLALAAAILEATIGYPAPLYLAIGHPVTWMGRWLAWLEPRLNRPEASFAARRAAGVLALCLYLGPIALVAWAATQLCLPGGALGFVVLAFLAASLPAQRSLAGHVKAVADGLDAGLDEGRRAVAKIVGRNPNALMRLASRARRSRAWRRIFPTASSLPSCGSRSAALSAARFIRRSTRPTA